MALDMLNRTLTFEIKHKPGYRLKMRMGMHSGPAVGGVVGTKIPHFGVFGETVEVASHMEAMGEPMKIQMTQATANILEGCGGFNIEPRGMVDIPKVII